MTAAELRVLQVRLRHGSIVRDICRSRADLRDSHHRNIGMARATTLDRLVAAGLLVERQVGYGIRTYHLTDDGIEAARSNMKKEGP